MPEVLDRLAVYYEREDELRKKISEALMYPAIITGVSVLMVLVLLFFVLPMLVNNFASFGIEPPLITQRVLAVRDWLAEFWYVALAVFFLLIFLGRFYFNTQIGRAQKDAVKLKIPVIGSCSRWSSSRDSVCTLALLLNSELRLNSGVLER